MTECLKVLASLSLSGSLAVLVLLLLRPLLRGRVSRRWQYYIWLVAVFRLLLPLAPEISPVGALFREAEAPAAAWTAVPAAPGAHTASPEAGTAMSPVNPAPPEVPAASQADSKPAAPPDPAEALVLLWLGGALVLLVWKITGCRSFSRCLQAGCREVEDPARLDLLAQAGEQLGVRRPVELYENPLAASPMLLGLFRPRVVLPSAAMPEADFRHTVLHELTHYRRRDLAYKWLVQITVCLHWFNPLAWVMAREIDRACELACDEAVLRLLEPEERRAYGDTLLRALEAGGGYHAAPGSAGLGQSAELLKERLTAIMNFKKPSRWTALLSLVLAAALITGAAAAGAYTGPVNWGANPVKDSTLPVTSDLTAASIRTNAASGSPVSSENLRLRSALLAERAYEDSDIIEFSVAIPFLSQEAQEAWLKRCYEDGNIAFFNSVLSHAWEWEDGVVTTFLERAYEDEDAAFFSVLVNFLEWDKEALDAWIARTANKNAALRSILLEAAGREGERDALEETLTARQMEEYKAAGITKEGRTYYYQGKPVRVFLDLRTDSSFVTLDMNPQGLLDIKVKRDPDGRIRSVEGMTEAEVAELFGDWKDPEDGLDGDGPVVVVPVDRDSLRKNTWCWLGEFTLSEGDCIRYDVSAETGNRMSIGFADMEHSPEEVSYCTISSARRENGVLRCGADFTIRGETVKPGRYRLFLHAPEGLGNVQGSVILDLQEVDPLPDPPVGDATSMLKEETSAAVQKAMEKCAAQTWYLIHSEGRQYLFYDSFPQRWFYQPVWEDGAWQVEIRPRQTQGAGYILLSFQDGVPLYVTLEGETVRLEDIQA